MPEILTESFCERCGTRYTFEAEAPSRGRFGRLRVASRGLRNYILSDESSLEEAFAEARSDDERSLTSQQLDAFHKTFNFCMSCRQYTCANCWNTAEGRCLTCAPHLGHEVLPAPFPSLDPRVGLTPSAHATGNGHAPDGRPEAWPAADLPDEPDAGTVADLGAGMAGPAPAPEARPTEPGEVTDGRAAAAAAETAVFLSRFRPGESLDGALAAYEAEAPGEEDLLPVSEPAADEVPAVAAGAAAETAAAEPVEAAPPTGDGAAPEPDVEVPPEPADEGAAAIGDAIAAAAIVAAPEVVAEPAAEVAAARDAREPVAEPPAPGEAAAAIPEPAIPEPATPEPAIPEPAEPAQPARLAAAAAAWQVVAPDTGDQPQAPVPPGTPAWPPLPPGAEAPQWPTAPAYAPAPPTSRGVSDDLLWAASSRDVLGQPAATGQAASAVQPCVSCGLALSATARFCRRCGTRQG